MIDDADGAVPGRVPLQRHRGGYPEGEPYFPHSPILTVTGSFAEAVVLETLVLSILNHDSAVAAAAARMVVGGRWAPDHRNGLAPDSRAGGGGRRAGGLPCRFRVHLEPGGESAVRRADRRHCRARVRAAARRRGRSAFRAQLDSLGASTTLLVDTYDIARGIEQAIATAGPGLGAVRIDSGDLSVMARHAREQLDRLREVPPAPRIVVSGDLDEFSIAALAAAPVDAYGAGTAVVTGSGAPTAGMVYKLVEVDGRPVAKRSEHKTSHGGRKTVLRAHKPSGTALEEIVYSGAAPEPAER